MRSPLLALIVVLIARVGAAEVLVGLRGRADAGLARFLEQQEHDVDRRWLTAAEFTTRFGASPRAVRRVSRWLHDAGCPVQRVGRQFLRCRRGNPGAPPASVAGLVDGMVDPSEFRVVIRSIGTRGDLFFSPAEFWRAYGLDHGSAAVVDGSGVTIGLLAASQMATDDLADFRTRFSLPPADFVQSPGARTGGIAEDEAALDALWSGAVAPAARIFLAVSTSAADAFGQLIGSNSAEVISSSIDVCPSTRRARAVGNRLVARALRQARAQGQTVLVASGDTGTHDCADGGHGLLASSSLVLAVGGTQPTPVVDAAGTVTSFGTETVWNDGNNASGGGPTALPRPAYQRHDGVASAKRTLPDVAFPASGVYPIIVEGARILAGGTSASAPAWAGVVARLVQKEGRRVGFLNTRIYQLGRDQRRGGTVVFHDVVTGSNTTGSARGFPATPGYDLATGWGSIDAAALFDAF